MTNQTTKMNGPLISRDGGTEVYWCMCILVRAHTHTYLHTGALADYLHSQLAYTPSTPGRLMSKRRAANRTQTLSHTAKWASGPLKHSTHHLRSTTCVHQHTHKHSSGGLRRLSELKQIAGTHSVREWSGESGSRPPCVSSADSLSCTFCHSSLCSPINMNKHDAIRHSQKHFFSTWIWALAMFTSCHIWNN